MARIRTALITALLLAPLAFGGGASAAAAQDDKSLAELRNTVINLLQGLVERGVLTREQAETMVKNAQAKAASDTAKEAAAAEAQEKAEANAVRVPYVPEIVREQIRKEVAAELAPQVTDEVLKKAKADRWGVPGALPEWAKSVRLSGDVRVRTEDDLFASDNARNVYYNILNINDKGGIGKAGLAAFMNTTEDRFRVRERIRLGMDVDLAHGWSLGARLTTGNLRDAVSTNQTLGNYGGRYQTQFDLGYLKWYTHSYSGRNALHLWAGRMPNPFAATTDLVWDSDLTFEGLAASYRLGLSRLTPYGRYLYLTVGAFPLQEVELSPKDKWLYGGQLGLEYAFDHGSRLRVNAGYYDYENVTGRMNALDSTLLDFTAPVFLQRGNTLVDIRNDTDSSTNLFALAAQYRLLNASASFDWRLTPGYKLGLAADWVRNVGYDAGRVAALLGRVVPPRVTGYQAEIAFGSASLAQARAWRALFGYRYVQRDAVLDAFTDSDFHLGGTDAQGYYFGADYSFTPHVGLRLRYLSANEIDGPPLGIDIWQIDLTGQF